MARQTALLIGPRQRFATFERGLALQRYKEYDILGILSEPAWQKDFPGPIDKTRKPVLGRLDDWEEIADRNHVQLVLFSVASESATDYPQLFDIIRRMPQEGN